MELIELLSGDRLDSMGAIAAVNGDKLRRMWEDLRTQYPRGILHRQPGRYPRLESHFPP